MSELPADIRKVAENVLCGLQSTGTDMIYPQMVEDDIQDIGAAIAKERDRCAWKARMVLQSRDNHPLIRAAAAKILGMIDDNLDDLLKLEK